MNRLTTNKEVSEMNMVELAHNSCFAKDRNATYRDFESEIDARDFIRKVGLVFGIFENDCEELTDDEAFDEVMTDCLQYGYEDKEGLLALLYRNLWAQANLYEKLKRYEDLEEQGLLLKLPCKVGDTLYRIDTDEKIKDAEVEHLTIENIVIYGDGDVLFKYDAYGGIICHLENIITDKPYLDFYRVFLTQAEAEEALKEMEAGK